MISPKAKQLFTLYKKSKTTWADEMRERGWEDHMSAYGLDKESAKWLETQIQKESY